MSTMSNEAVAEHILYIVHKYDADWNDTMKKYEQERKYMAELVGINFDPPEQPTKPPATVLLDRIKATLEHYND
jgi:hypothetical protein